MITASGEILHSRWLVSRKYTKYCFYVDNRPVGSGKCF